MASALVPHNRGIPSAAAAAAIAPPGSIAQSHIESCQRSDNQLNGASNHMRAGGGTSVTDFGAHSGLCGPMMIQQQLPSINRMQDYSHLMQGAHYGAQSVNGVPGVSYDPTPLQGDPTTSAVQSLTADEAASLGGVMASGATGNEHLHFRRAAGQIWNDPTLDEWPENDFRVFCGDLGNEVTDDVLAGAFRKYKSFQKARVVRDKRTGKTKGYGFVSFTDPQDMLNSIKEMNFKYVGNRPIRVLRSKWKEREINSERNKALKSVVTKIGKNDSKTLRKFKKLGVNINGGKAARNYELLASQAPRIRKNYVPPVAYGRMTYQYIKGSAPSLPAPAPGTGASSHLLDDI